ncbi:EI24 domain-containing protein [Kutzneria sp. CA-103260]|uniref:EI24 domain-containing protein n=1 Tax=Kutzneria sp. CA-103260 TaxID=2802641 RepID=UPI001BA967C9|nr:EI24 domain-containing protein [Kutzneria sp. CA-103260]
MIRDFFAGIGLLLRGFGIVFRTPRLLLLGALPALLTGGLLLALVIGLAVFLPGVIDWATPFLDGWDPTYRELLRELIGVAAVVALIYFGLLLFAAVTLAVGAPFYESIARRVEDRLGGVSTEHDTSWWTDTMDNAKVVGTSALLSIPMFFIDLVPGIGEFAGPVIGVCVSAWLFGLELSVVPFSRRGLPLAARRHMLGRRRAMAFGFALPAYLLCLVPLLAVIVMPAATAGGTLLAHRLLEDQARAPS